MAKPIYKLFFGNWTEAWHQLSPEEQANLLARVNNTLEQVGGKSTVMCDSGWSSEQWPFFGVEEFPDLEALQKHSGLLAEINWYRYVTATTVLGTPYE